MTFAEANCYRRSLLRLIPALVTFALLALPGPARAAVLYWDADGSTNGNNASTGANLGGSGIWSSADARWWETSLGTSQVWSNGSDAIFWGTAGPVTVSTVSANVLAFRTTGYSLNSGTLTMVGAAVVNTETGVTATVSTTIAGTNTMVKFGPGTLVLANTNNINTANSAAGGWRIEGGGTLRIMADESLGAPLPDTARNTVTDIQLNQATIQAGGSFAVSQNRRTKINTNASTNRGDAIIDVDGNVFSWFGSLQGGAGSLRVTSSNGNGGMLILGTDKIASINPFGSVLPAGATNLTVQDGVVVQTSGQVTPTGGELGSETNNNGAVLTILLQGGGQIRSESGGYTFLRNLVLGPGGGSLDVGAWIQTFDRSAISGPGSLTKWGRDVLILNNSTATWTGGTRIRDGTLQLGVGGSFGLLPGVPGNPSSVDISAGATLRFQRGSDKSFFDNISGAGGITIANSPTTVVRLVSDNTYTGVTRISSGMLMIGQGSPGQPGSLASSVVTNTGTLIFNRVEDLTYAGAISGSGAVTKQAAGRLVLTGTHTYTGATTVSGGTLAVNGTLGTSPVTVTGGTLSGTGVIKGPVTVQSGGRFAPGSSIGIMTISNTLTLSGVSVMELGAATGISDSVRGVTTVIYGGSLALSNLTGSISASNTFKLFAANTYRGAFASLVPSIPGPNLAWNTNTLTTDGTLRVVSTSPVTMANSISNGLLTLSWPADHTSWRLQVQTNSLSRGLSTNWFTVPNAIVTNQMTFTVDPANGCVFYRLIYP
jgi:autotransporter-associated beta strand protein